jgi:chorismate mutase
MSYTTSQREAALQIRDDEVADHPEIIAARRALREASKIYRNTMKPRLAALRRLEELRAELAQVEAAIVELEERRAEVAVAVTDGAVPPDDFHRLAAAISSARLNAERIRLALPVIEARYHATSTPTERTARDESDAQRALAEAVKAAKLELAVERGA